MAAAIPHRDHCGRLYWGLGRLLDLNLAEYQLLGIPLLILFQLWIQRQPFRTLWVRSGPPLQLDARFYTLWALFALVPAYDVVKALAHLDLANTAMYGTGIAGAFGLAYAIRSMRKATAWQVVFCLLTVGGIAALPILLTLVLPLHFHVGGAQPGPAAAAHVALLPGLLAGVQTLLWGLPAGFLIEEVFFRGALDTYLHSGEQGTGWLSAIFVSALWGLWHMPGAALAEGHLLSRVISLVVPQIVLGVPLSLWWRKSGNLAVNNATHAVLDAVRSILGAVA